ncbi:pyridoxal kinase [Suttonella sp. R2A3]|uniref:pyridoxal kinase n=1 Tax=Suttonella sp. R2A3 TaxID=2908648 RepID=UPI001F3402E0|nr:pyridoxal kinase [Suttonella sp. R2A3]UJF23795.1 pyridoxal kinase [Suttonella sp. R2A3]
MDYSHFNPLTYHIVSVQSQVIYGTVGNNAAMPTLDDLGHRAIAVPSVLLSNTPFYGTNAGGIISDEWFAGYLRDIDLRGAIEPLRAIITGYLGAPSQALILSDWIGEQRQKHPEMIACIDPVMGDSDSGLYVDPNLASAYRDTLIYAADILTPNHFEVEYLTGGTPLTSTKALVNGARSLLHDHLRALVVTSACLDDTPADQISILIVTKDSVDSFHHPRVDCNVRGSGDTFNAALTAALLDGKTLREAAEQAADYVIRAMRQTAADNLGELLLPPRA